ncbi:MAG: formate dehydrogenase subunit delta [Burkholderiaceae bacterium]
MDIHNLISMANRIGQFFESFSDRDEALEGISNHIRKFWEPRMRQALLSQCDAGNAEGLLPIVGEAIRAHRAELS